MAKKLGNDYRLWIETATAGTYAEIKGQTSSKISRQSSTIDTSTKDDYPYGTQAPGLKSLTLDVELFPNLPDVSGYGRLEARAQLTDATNFQIRKGGSAGGTADVVFAASLYIGNFDSDFAKNDVVKCTAQLTLAAPPTVDTLG
ncbi:MAG: phage tail tube protein [Sphingomonas fennica]